MTLRALIFDVDGTLAETEELHRRAFNMAFPEFGLEWQWDQQLYRHLLGVTGGKERIASYMDETGYPADDPLRAQIPEMHAAKTRFYTGFVSSGELELRPGVLRLMGEALAANLEIAIATTTSVANVKALLETNFPAGIVEAIKIIGAGDMVTKKKPAPDVYDLVVEKLGFKASECVAFEDSRNGLLSAMAANIPTLITPGIYTDDHDFTGAASVVSDLGEPDAPNRHISGVGAEFDHVSTRMLRVLV